MAELSGICSWKMHRDQQFFRIFSLFIPEIFKENQGTPEFCSEEAEKINTSSLYYIISSSRFLPEILNFLRRVNLSWGKRDDSHCEEKQFGSQRENPLENGH